MKNLFFKAIAIALFAVGTLSAIPEASAQKNYGYGVQQHRMDRHIGGFCGRNGGAAQCNDWRQNRSGWNDSHYQRFYTTHRRNRDFGSEQALRLLGFGIGAAIGNTIVNAPYHSQSRSCAVRYRTYDARSNTFMGHDGYRHACRL